MDAGNIFRSVAFLACITAAAQQVPTSQPPVLHLDSGIVPPFVLSKPKSDYTEEARLAKLEGSVLLSMVVGADGQPRDIRVVRSLGLGLDESAIENVRAWQFKPGTRNGSPVDVQVNEEVFFRSHRTLWDWHVVRIVLQPSNKAARPVLIKAKFPATIDFEQNASVTIAFNVGTNGVPASLRVVKSSDPRWESQLLAAVRDGWRFRPGLLDQKTLGSQPTPVPVWVELVRGSHSPIPPAAIPAP